MKTAAARKYHEDKWICKLKISASHDLNTEIGDYAKQNSNFYQFNNELCLKFDINPLFIYKYFG